MTRAELGRELPDEPRWVEATDLLACDDVWIAPAGRGHLIGHDDSKLVIAVGATPASAILAHGPARAGWSLLVVPERAALVEALAAAGWPAERAILHTLPDPDTLPDDTGAAVLAAAASLAHVPADLALELERARRDRPLWSVALGGVPAAFAYAAARSPRWFDVSIDTLPDFRGLGLATRAAAALIRAERAAGREPVWGAVESNIASLRLAARLGFVPVDQLWVVTVA